MTLSFNQLNTHTNHNFFRVFDGNSTSSPQLSSASNDATPSSVFTSSSNALLIVFSDDIAEKSYQGFQATFTAAQAENFSSDKSIHASNLESNTSSPAPDIKIAPAKTIETATGPSKFNKNL